MEIGDNSASMVSYPDIIPQRKGASFDNLYALKFSMLSFLFMRKTEAKF